MRKLYPNAQKCSTADTGVGIGGAYAPTRAVAIFLVLSVQTTKLLLVARTIYESGEPYRQAESNRTRESATEPNSYKLLC